MTPKKVREFFSRLAAADPEPKGELEFATPYQLLVAVVLSAQATDKGVNRATRPLFRVSSKASCTASRSSCLTARCAA